MKQFNGFCDVYDNGKILSCMRLEYVENTVNRLNELHDENIGLKQDLKLIQDSLWTTEVIRNLEKENEQLKQQKDKWKQQCIHFKEMLDDMDIAYLCDEWIYEELKGELE